MVYTLLQLAIFAAIVISRENDLDHSLTRSLTLFLVFYMEMLHDMSLFSFVT